MRVLKNQKALQAQVAQPNVAPQPTQPIVPPKLTPLRATAVHPVVPMNAVAPSLQGKADQSGLSVLANYDVELLIDCSASMREKDCPGSLSRWDWCGFQAKSLGRQLAALSPNGLTVTTYGCDYDVYHGASPDSIADIFENPKFRPGTHLAEPLADRLISFLDNRKTNSKPLLIAVITDGAPSPRRQIDMVVKTLINATKSMKGPHEVTVVFFQIGSTNRFGRAFVSYLDNNLIREGAHYDMVRAVSFEDLQRTGLARALADSIHDVSARNLEALKQYGYAM